MKNVTKILTAVVLCAAVFASTERVSSLGGNAAFWPGDEANISAFPAQINNHGFLQVDGMGSSEGSVGMVFSDGDHNWGLNWSNSASDFINLGWGKDGMGLNLNYKMWTTANTLTWTGNDDAVDASCSDGVSADQAACEAAGETWTAASAETFSCSDATLLTEGACTNSESNSGFGLSFGKDLGDMGEIGVHFKSGDGQTEGFMIDYRKSCGFWVFTDMVANLDSPDGGDMKLDVDWFGHMDAGVADVMLATGMIYDMADDGGITLTSNVGVEAAVTDAVTIRGGMGWAYALTNDGGDQTGAVTTGDLDYAWSTGVGVNMGSFNVDMSLTDSFWNNPFGFISGNADTDDATGNDLWGSITATYSF